MCVLCGEFVAQPHWTDRHVEDRVRSGERGVGDYQRDRRRDRIHRVGLVNEVLRSYGAAGERLGWRANTCYET